ncbi:Hypothetical Protein XCAW_02451 [Xanthomonas citri subsp. citri Aw12879]|nr:Hypothetical Protein XCAW_02451 [Xanthomonas citri subsp. citri Aw12879]
MRVAHGRRSQTARPAAQSRIAAQRDVADPAHPPRLPHLARPRARRRPARHRRPERLYRRDEQDEARAEQDDPYSDWWMLRIEEKLSQTDTALRQLREQMDRALTEVPAALSLGDNLNVQPIRLPLFVNAQLGFMAVYLLADYDELARKLILAHHTALIDRSTLERWLNEGAHALRSLFSLAQQYRYSGCTRDDFAARNAAARAALEKFGELPQEVLEGTRRSRYAPPIVRRSALGRTAGASDDTGGATTPAPAAIDGVDAVDGAGEARSPDGNEDAGGIDVP